MFDALLGRKFTAKCKHAIKCIYERLKPIRNRKQSVVNILRNDIADLLRNGNVEHAFGRMDELITEINRLACYDMIEKLCEDVLIQLPVLQKQREFPPEDREAMSTLIFAAARFSDLPELSDLRQAFTTRYGSALEMSVNPEFKEKSATKTFSAARKLQLMKNIASEYSVNWDSESFEFMITNPTASKCDQPKKRVDARQDPKPLPVSEKDGLLKHMVTKAKDIHVIKHEPDPTKKIKPWADGPENMTSSAIDSSNPHAKPEKDKYANYAEDWRRKNDSHRVSSRTQEVLDPINQDSKVVEQPKSKDDRRDGRKVPPDTWEPNGTDAEYSGNGAHVCKRTSRAQVMLKPDGEEGIVIEKAKLKDETRVRHVVPPPVQQESIAIDVKESHDSVYRRSSRGTMDHREEKKQAVGQQEFEDNYKPRKVPLYTKQEGMNDVIGSAGHDKGLVHEKPGKARQQADLTPQDGPMVEPQKPDNNRAFHMIPPPYVKSAVGKVGANSEHARPSGQPNDEGVFAASGKSSSKPSHVGVSAASDNKSNNGAYKDLPKDELVADDERPKPRSVRRKQQKSPNAQEVDGAIHDHEPVPGIPHGQRRRSSRQNAFTLQDNYDEEEKVMEKLLMHYSKKGTPDQPSKHGTRTRALSPDHTLDEGEAGTYETSGRYQIHKMETVKAAHLDQTINNGEADRQQSYRRHRIPKAEPAQVLPADHVVQDGEAMLYQAYSRYRVHRPVAVHPPERVVSLPPDPTTPKEMIKGPARTTSMQPHLPSPRPQLPDYEELAARFAALKRL